MKLPFSKKKDKGAPQSGANAPVVKNEKSKVIGQFEKGMVSLIDVIAPSSVEVDFRYIRVGERYYSTLFVIGYPRFVSPNWLQPLIDYDHTLDIAMYIYPAEANTV